MFSKQLLNQITLSGLNITSTKNCHITLEAIEINDDLSVNVKITNMTTNLIETGNSAFIQLATNTYLEIRDSTIQYIYWYEDGSVLKVDGLNAEARFYNSKLHHNAAIKGGVFIALNNGDVKVYDSEIKNNFAITSGVIDASSNGAFQFYRSKIFNNVAISAPIAQMFSIFVVSVVNNCEIYNNLCYSESQVKSYITSETSWDQICWLNSNFKEYLLNNPSLLDHDQSVFIFEIVYSSLLIENSTAVSYQSNLANGFVSTITLNDSTFSNWSISVSFVQVTEATLIINNIKMTNTSESVSKSQILSSASNAKIFIDGFVANDSTTCILNLRTSICIFNNMTISNSESVLSIFILRSSMNTTITNLLIESTSQTTENAIEVIASKVYLLKNITIDGLSTDAVSFFNSKIYLVDGIYIRNVIGRWIINYGSQVTLITNSEFTSNGRLGINDKGRSEGWIHNRGGNLTITNSEFVENRALKGAAVSNICNEVAFCSATFRNVSFKKGEGFESGGAIYYDVFRPIMENITFEGNIAPYGPDISSYPIKIILKGSTNSEILLEGVASGQTLTEVLIFQIVDYDNQIYANEAASSIKINNIDENSEVSGATSQALINGTASFLGIAFAAKPGSKNVKFRASSNAINSATLLKMFGKYLNL